MRRVLTTGLHAWRSIAGDNSTLERVLRRTRARVKKDVGPGYVQYTGQRFVHITSTARSGPTKGIFMKGACDLPSMFVAAPLIRERLSGSCCIFYHPGGIAGARPDVLLQTLQGIEDEKVRDVVAPSLMSAQAIGKFGNGKRGSAHRGRLRLRPDYFKPSLFE